MLRRSFVLLGVTVCFAFCIGLSSVFAQEMGGDCANDVAKFCADVERGGGRILQCLGQHDKELSPACKIQMANMKNNTKQAQRECAGDVEKFCKGIQPGGGRIIKCLKEHQSELSPACAASARIGRSGNMGQ